MLCSCAPVITAEEVVSEASNEELSIIPISDMDSMNGWSGTASLDATNPYQGSGSLAISFETVSAAGDIKFQYNHPTTTYDISGMSYVCFDVYLSEADTFSDVEFELELRSPGGTDSHEYRIKQALSSFIVGTPQDGWNRVQVAIADMTHVGTASSASWSYLRFFNSANATVGSEGTTSTIKMDNAYFADATVSIGSSDTASIVITGASLKLNNSFKVDSMILFKSIDSRITLDILFNRASFTACA